MDLKKVNVKKPFLGKKVYFSNSITGVRDIKRNFGWKLVNYMKEGGAEVLSDFVGARSKKEHIKMFLEKTGFDRSKDPNPWFFVRKTDIDLVDKATHVVAVVNASSFGVGMELQRAIDKPKMGMNETPVLCLIEKKLLKNLSMMVRGISQVESPKFRLTTYGNIEQAMDSIYIFLSS